MPHYTLNIKHLCVGDSDVPDWSEFGKMLPRETRDKQEKCDIGHINDISLEEHGKSWRKIWKYRISHIDLQVSIILRYIVANCNHIISYINQ